MKTSIIAVLFTGIILNGCNSSSYKTETIFHSKYDKRLQIDPNYKISVQDLNLLEDIQDNSIFCYSTATTTKEKMQKLIEGLRSDIPIDCGNNIDTSGGYSCLVENELLDITAQEKSINDANGYTSSDLQTMAQENGYDADVVYKSFVQKDLSETEMILTVERKMKTDPEFCAYVVGKKTIDLGVGYETKNNKRYWTIIWGKGI